MNVIAIVLDTFRSDIIGPGKRLSFVETPNLDALAAESIVFDHAFGEGQPTLQCRRSFYTGCRSFPFVYNVDRRGHWHHMPGWHKIPAHQDTLAEILLARGYCTGMVADVYHMFKPTMNYWRGFLSYDFIRGQESDNWRSGPLNDIRKEMAQYTRNPENLQANAVLCQYLLNQRFRRSEEDYQCARVFRGAADWLDENAANAPFFLWVEAFDPHEPWDPPPSYADRYSGPYDGIDFIMPRLGPDPTPAEIERTKALYYGEVTFVDRWVGHLLQRVDDLGLWDDTIVLVLSDHGTQIWDHGAFGKGGANLRTYNTGIVCQMRVPGMKARAIDAIVQAHDVMPTLLELLDVPFSRLDGTSLLPLLRGETDAVRQASVIGWATIQPHKANAGAYASVRTPRWNYISAVHEDGREWLYDILADPDENQNLITAHPEVAAALRREIEAVVGQPLPAKLNEVCDPEAFPMARYLQGTVSHGKSLMFSPLTIRRWTLHNRVVMPPMVTMRDIAGEDGREWYARHAAGGVGLVIVEATGIPRFTRDLTPETLRPLVEAIHAGGALAAIQLFPLDFGTDREVASLTPEEIQAMVAQFRHAARICREAGMDGVEPHGAHGFLLNRFFSPLDNPRHDDYGGSLENRMRLGLDIVRAIKDEVGDDMLLLYRHTPVKDDRYGMEESLAFARELVQAGVDVLDISPSSLEAPGDRAAPFRACGVPVITVGTLDESGRAEEALSRGRADLVAIGRALIADPDWTDKKKRGAEKSITRCSRCNDMCFGNLKKRIPIACTRWDDAPPKP